MKTSLDIDPYIVDVLMPDLVGHDRKPSAFVVYVALWRRAGGTKRETAISLQTLASATGLSRTAVQGALVCLRRRRLVHTTRSNPTSVPRHRVMTPWRR